MKTTTSKHTIAVLTLMLVATLTASAQSFTLTGRVVDEEQNPIELVGVVHREMMGELVDNH